MFGASAGRCMATKIALITEAQRKRRPEGGVAACGGLSGEQNRKHRDRRMAPSYYGRQSHVWRASWLHLQAVQHAPCDRLHGHPAVEISSPSARCRGVRRQS